MSNHLNQFYAAVSVLVGHGNIKQRLIQAYEENIASMEESEIPLAVTQSFADLRQIMSGVTPLNGEGRIRATVRKMSIIEADGCAQMMVDLYAELLRCEDQAQESLPLIAGEQLSVPPFLIKSN